MKKSKLLERRRRCYGLIAHFKQYKWETADSCNICNSEKQILLTAKDRYGITLRSVICENCGLVYLKDRLTRESYFDFYSEGVYRKIVSAYNGKSINNEHIFSEQKSFPVKIINAFDQHLKLKAGGNIIDIGGSTGFLANALSDKYDLAPTILDPAVDELKFNNRQNITLINKLIEDINPADYNTYDIVLMYQTVDHLFDLKKAFRNIYQLMKDDAIFIFDIVDFYQCCRLGYPEEYIKIDHCYYLSDQNMDDFLSRNNFELIGKDYCSAFGHVNYICRKLPEKKAPVLQKKPNINEINLFYLNRTNDFHVESNTHSVFEKLTNSLYRYKNKLLGN